MKRRIVLALVVMTGLTTHGSIRVEHVGMAAADIIEIIVQTGQVTIGKQEPYWDVFWYPIVCEFTVQHPMAQAAYAWGYLAGARE